MRISIYKQPTVPGFDANDPGMVDRQRQAQKTSIEIFNDHVPALAEFKRRAALMMVGEQVVMEDHYGINNGGVYRLMKVNRRDFEMARDYFKDTATEDDMLQMAEVKTIVQAVAFIENDYRVTDDPPAIESAPMAGVNDADGGNGGASPTSDTEDPTSSATSTQKDEGEGGPESGNPEAGGGEEAQPPSESSTASSTPDSQPAGESPGESEASPSEADSSPEVSEEPSSKEDASTPPNSDEQPKTSKTDSENSPTESSESPEKSAEPSTKPGENSNDGISDSSNEGEKPEGAE